MLSVLQRWSASQRCAEVPLERLEKFADPLYRYAEQFIAHLELQNWTLCAFFWEGENTSAGSHKCLHYSSANRVVPRRQQSFAVTFSSFPGPSAGFVCGFSLVHGGFLDNAGGS